MTAKHFAEFSAPLGPNDRTFCLRPSDIVVWEAEHDKSLMGAFSQMVTTRSGWLSEVRDVIRHALIGGGMTQADALMAVTLYVDSYPLGEAIPLALAIMEAALYGSEDYRKNKAEADGTKDV